MVTWVVSVVMMGMLIRDAERDGARRLAQVGGFGDGARIVTIDTAMAWQVSQSRAFCFFL